MNHKILTNQIMLSLTMGYLSPCLSLSLSLGSLPLPPGNKESFGQITPLRVVTLGPTFTSSFLVFFAFLGGLSHQWLPVYKLNETKGSEQVHCHDLFV
jgi:hypothetical protein